LFEKYSAQQPQQQGQSKAVESVEKLWVLPFFAVTIYCTGKSIFLKKK
jgi:hypothetical protein